MWLFFSDESALRQFTSLSQRHACIPLQSFKFAFTYGFNVLLIIRYSFNLCVIVLVLLFEYSVLCIRPNNCAEMAGCGVCVKAVGPKQVKITCSDCNLTFHGGCVGMNKSEIDCVTAENLPWRCSRCSKNRRQSMRMDSAADEGNLTLQDIMDSINEVKNNQRSMEKDFNTSYESLQDQLKENTEALKIANLKNEEYLKLINELMAENNNLKKRVQELESKSDDLEQYSRVNSLEIHGIPHTANENVFTVVKQVGKALDLEITDTMVDACHRLGRSGGSSNPPGIIVKFVRRLDKEEMLRMRRVKRNLSTRHMGMTMDQPVFINESLTKKRRQLFNAARNAKKENKYKYLWVRNGNIFMRKDDGDKVIAVNYDTDFTKI